MSLLRLHAACVAITGRGVLLLGESGMGKSDLALRLIDRGAELVADDYVEIDLKGNAVLASAPEATSGLIEVRGVGIFRMKARKRMPVHLAVQLTRQEWIERLPHPEPYLCLGVSIPKMCLCSFESSAAIKVEMAMNALEDDSMTVGALKE